MHEAQLSAIPSRAIVPRQRDDAIDILRGIAVVTMIGANLSAKALADPHPLWFRLLGSFAAPLFVLLAGMMIQKTHSGKNRGFRFFAMRGLMLVAGGVLIDVCFEGIYPFTSMDVLYLIGISLPLGFLCLRCPTSVRWGMTFAIFAATPFLQHYLGYTEYPTEYYLRGKLVGESKAATIRTNIGNHVLIDGWFPLLPWFGFTLLGLNLAGWRWQQENTRSFGTIAVLGLSTLFLSVGTALAFRFPGPLLIRDGYSELFYPPTIGYLVMACGVILLLFWGADHLPRFRILHPIRVFGQTAFFTYLLHRAIIAFAISDQPKAMSSFLLVYAGLVGFCLVIAYALRWSRKFLKEIMG